MTEQPHTKKLAIVGTGIAHSLAPAIHNFIANAIGLPYEFGLADTPDIKSFVQNFRSEEWVGAVVTLPHKISVIPLLDEADDHVKALRACNGIWKKADGSIVGTNTDWRGIYGSLVSAPKPNRECPALIIGAGGASRAAVYALSAHLQCKEIYVINRDPTEVDALISDVHEGYSSIGLQEPTITHLRSIDEASRCKSPYYIVGTVPDFEPSSSEEILARDMLQAILKAPEKGVLLDMCYKPRETRHIILARADGWETIDGVNIIAYQIEEQWSLWAGTKEAEKIPVQEARKVLYEAAVGGTKRANA